MYALLGLPALLPSTDCVGSRCSETSGACPIRQLPAAGGWLIRFLTFQVGADLAAPPSYATGSANMLNFVLFYSSAGAAAHRGIVQWPVGTAASGMCAADRGAALYSLNLAEHCSWLEKSEQSICCSSLDIWQLMHAHV